MSVIDDALSAILRGSNPEASPEDIASQVEGLKRTGGAAVDQALSFIPGMSTMKDVAMNAPAMAQEAVKNPTVQSIASGLTGGPIAPGVPNPGNPISSIGQGIASHMMSADPMPPKAEEPQLPEPIQSAGPTPIESAPKPTQKMPKIEDAILPDETANNDNEARKKAMEEAERRRKLSNVPAAIAGVGDAIASGASAFGVNAPTDKQDKLMARAKANFDESKTLFDDNIKNDPNSDISKAYRQMVSQIAPDMANKPAFQNMSAQMIGDKLPLIETMMRAQSSKDTKEQQIEANRLAREANMQSKKEREGDELWTPLGQTKSKNDAKLVKDAYSSYMDTKAGIEELINLRKDKGAEMLDRGAVARGKTAAANLLLQYKNLAKLGVLSKDDYKILDRLIPQDPLQVDITDSTLSKLQQFNREVDKKMSNFSKVHGVNQPPELSTQDESTVTGKSSKKPAKDPLGLF